MKQRRETTSDELAEIHGVHVKTVRAWVRDGCPHTKRGGAFLFNEDEAAAWLFKTERKLTPGRPAEPKTPVPPELEGDRDYWLARKYRLQCLKEEGRLLDVDEVKQFVGELLSVFRNNWAGYGAGIVPRLQGRDAAEQQGILDARSEELFSNLATTLNDRFGGGAQQ